MGNHVFWVVRGIAHGGVQIDWPQVFAVICGGGPERMASVAKILAV
ncbi:hypothetical protein OG936_33990 [Streptomyces sp. NBC_00846]|nr:hypothetical protein OG936_33990 [Streptomyces sp. NBC_00846]